jgi:lysyl-tRNA synthetase class II
MQHTRVTIVNMDPQNGRPIPVQHAELTGDEMKVTSRYVDLLPERDKRIEVLDHYFSKSS